MKATFLMILAWLVNLLQAQADILQTITPKISWTNIGIDVPNIVIFFETNFHTQNTLSNPWLKISIPWLAYSMNAQWAMLPVGTCSTTSLTFSATTEERVGADEIWTTFYVQMNGATYVRGATYALKFTPDRYMDYEGYSDPMRLAFVSRNMDGHITYAYNNAFTNFYGIPAPNFDIIISDQTEDPNKTKLNRIINSQITVQIKDGVAERLLIKASGDYTFADDTEIKCTTVADTKSEIEAVPREDYTCKFFQEVGGSNKNYLSYTWKKGKIPGGQYKLFFTLKTPEFGGKHNLIVYAMDRQGPRIQTMAKLDDLFQTVPSSWAPDYPKIKYSFGLSATDTSVPLGVGLYSMTNSYNQVYNSLVFEFKASEQVLSIPSDKSFEVQIQLGTTQAVVPLGTVNHDLTPSLTKTKVLKSYSNGVLSFKDVLLFNGKIYKISMKVGYPEPENLGLSSDTGFGYVSLIYEGTVIFKSRANFKAGFNKIFDNKNLLTNEWIALQDGAQLKRHRGTSAFRSGSGLSTYADYEVSTNKHGLRKGDGQDFFFQGSLGPNHMFYASFLENGTHISSNTFVEIITSKSISSKTTSWDDRFKSNNCQMYIAKYSKWMDEINTADAQNEVTDALNIITTPPADYNFIGGCSYKEIVGDLSRYSRFRFRFDDKQFVNQFGDNLWLRGINFTLINQNDLNTPEGIHGNIYIWRNIDIGSYQSEINNGDSDSVILDAFVLTYFFSSSAVTDSDIVASPSITTMDSMYVLGDNDAAWPVASIRYAPKLGWMDRDLGKTAPDLQLSANYGEHWPNVMHIHGQMGTVDKNTFVVKLFFDFVEPITKEKDSEIVDCSVIGIDVSKCELFEGIPDLTISRFRDVTLTQQNIYSYNSRYSYALMVFIDPQNINPGDQFSITFPFRYSISANLDGMNIATYNDGLTATPAVVFLDNTYSPLDYIDYGINGSYDYGVPVYHTDNYIGAALNTFQIPTGSVTLLDDGTANNNPQDASWFDITPLSSLVGDKTSFQWNTNCAACQDFITDEYDFGATIMCSNWDFTKESTFSVQKTVLPDNRRRCHSFKYYFDGTAYAKTSTNKYCMYCPEVDTVADPTNDVISFDVTDFTLPNYSGLKWPSDVYSAVGGRKISQFMQMKDLTKQMQPNILTIVSNNIDIKKGTDSFRIDLSFTLKNPLPKGSSIYLNKQLGSMTFIMSILGSDQTPPCYSKQTLPSVVNTFRCEYTFVNDGIQINILEDVPNGTLEFALYGVSSGETITPNIKFEVWTFLDQLRTPALQVDSADVAFYVTMNYVAPSDPPAVVVSNVEMNNWQKGAFGNLKFKITLSNRDLNENDFLSVNLGAASIANNPELILCRITDLNETLIHEKAAVCNVENLDDVKIKFLTDITDKEFIVHLNYVEVPSFTTPGLTATFKFNGDYISFSSNELPYQVTSPVTFVPTDYNKLYKNPVLLMNLDGRGHRTDLILTITPNSPISIYSIIYLRFSPQFSPGLSTSSIFVYEVPEDSAATYTPVSRLQSWISEPHTLAITGWQFSLDSKRPYSIKIVGVDAPGIIEDRAVQVLIGTENGLLDAAGVTEWGQTQTSEGIQGSDTGMIFIQDLQYDSKIIRVKSGLYIDFEVEKNIGRYVYFGIWFDYLSNEVFRTFTPSCSMQKIDSTTETITTHSNGEGYVTNCQILGHRLEMFLIDDLKAGETYRIRIEDMPNPDYGFCEPIPLRVIISNAIKTKTLLASSSFVNNINKDPFTNKEGEKILNFVSIPDGYLTVWRGFYDIVYIGPASNDPNERLYFTDKVSFTLSYDLDGLFASTPISFYGISKFQSAIGESRTPFLIGSSTNTVTTSYVLNILRAESFVTQYTELPLLKIQVINQKAQFQVPTAIKVFKAGTSVPIDLVSEKLPIIETWFTVQFVGSTPGLSFVDELVEFSISTTDPIFFMQVAATSNTLLTNAQVRISPKESTSPYDDTLINLVVLPKTAGSDPNLVISYRDITQFGMKLDFACDQEVHILYYFSPIYSFQEFSRTTIEAWVKRGITQLGDTQIGYALINDAIDPSTKIYDNLLSETEYKVKVYYVGPQRPTAKLSKESSFTTLSRSLRNGVFEIEFNEPIFSSRKQWLLCLLSIEYAIPSEDLWTEDGVNCEGDNMADYVKRYHTNRETLINDTIAAEAAKNQVSTNTTDVTTSTTTTSTQSADALLEPLKYTKILIFGSKREYQPIDIYDLLFKSTREDSNTEQFERIFKNQATIKSMGNLILLHLSNAPTINGTPTFSPKIEQITQDQTTSNSTETSIEEPTTLTKITTDISGISLTEKGFLLIVWGKPESFGSSPTKASLTDVNSYAGFYYNYYNKGASISVTVEDGLVEDTEYSVYMIAFNDDPRKNALSSPIVNGSFKITKADTTASGLIYRVISSMLVLLVVYMRN